MIQGRRLCKISLIIAILIALSAYGPWDFLGVYGKAQEAKDTLAEDMLVEARGTVYQKEIKQDYYLYYVNDATVYTDNGKLLKTSFIFKSNSFEIPLKAKVNISGRVKPFSKARNEGSFDMENYYWSKGVYFQLEDVKVNDYTSDEAFLSNSIIGLRERIADVYGKNLPGEEAGFLSSVVLGERSGLENQLKDLFQQVGMAHILAVSGLHISVVCMCLYKLLRRLGIGFLGSGIISGQVAVCYGMLTGASISSVRAIGMFLIFLVAQMLGECYDMLSAMSTVGLMLLFENPLYIRNSSFIFSFSAVLVIWYVAIPITQSYELYCKKKCIKVKLKETYSENRYINKLKRIVEKAISGLIFSVGIFVGMMPITVMFYYQTPIYSVLINLLVIPLMPALLGLGLFGGFLGLIIPVAAVPCLLLCHYLIYFYEWIAGVVISMPGAVKIVGDKGIFVIIAYYVILFGLIHGLTYIKDYFISAKDMCNIKWINNMNRRFVVVQMVTALILTVILILPTSSNGFEIDFIDVGQGDGIYIDSGDGTRFFVDGGSSSNDELGQYTLLPYLKYKGAGEIDYWFLSHMDLDHVSGVLYLLENGYTINNIVLSAAIPEDETLNRLLSLAAINNTNIIYMKQGDIINTKHLSFKCVYPFDGASDEDINALSLSLLMEYDYNLDTRIDYSGFFGGDIGAEQEKVIASGGEVGKVNFLKVSHHGSRFSSDEDFLKVLSPDVAVISCSKKNRYGHPAAEAVERIENIGAKIFYTMDSGRIRIDDDGIDLFID
ncbi:MAG: DNA internalization-related competence protein ComEC/Rec2 [Pseudobutyrivibrio sp.]|nr:DNA internalization-related competence protein ComEC/Rec2 [Pseudobutyrivibrio sp.]